MTDDSPTDVVHVEITEYASYSLTSGFLSGGGTLRDDGDAGITVHRHDDNIAVSAGTANDSDEDEELYTYHAMSADDARSLAAGLRQAADEADAYTPAASREESESKPSLLRRLMG